jgi:hypothetical protein
MSQLTQIPLEGRIKVADVRTVFNSYITATQAANSQGARIRAANFNNNMHGTLPAVTQPRERVAWSQLRGLTSGPPDPVVHIPYGTEAVPTVEASPNARTLTLSDTSGNWKCNKDITRSYVLNISNSRYQTINSFQLTTPASTSYSKAFFIHFTQLPATSGHIIASAPGTSSGYHSIWYDQATQKIRAYHSQTSATLTADVTDTAVVTLNTWIHYIVTYDGVTGTMKLYRNGVEVASKTGVTALTNGSLCSVGRFVNNGNNFTGPLVNTWNGTTTTKTLPTNCAFIDDVKIWDKALSANDVTSIYNADVLPVGNHPWVNTGYMVIKSVVDGTYAKILRVQGNYFMDGMIWGDNLNEQLFTADDAAVATAFSIEDVNATDKRIMFRAPHFTTTTLRNFYVHNVGPNFQVNLYASTVPSNIISSNSIYNAQNIYTIIPGYTLGCYFIRSGNYPMSYYKIVTGTTAPFNMLGMHITLTFPANQSNMDSGFGYYFYAYYAEFELIESEDTGSAGGPITLKDINNVSTRIYNITTNTTYDLTTTQINGTSWNDRINSITVPLDMMVTLREGEPGQNGYVTIQNYNNSGVFTWPWDAAYLASTMEIVMGTNPTPAIVITDQLTRSEKIYFENHGSAPFASGTTYGDNIRVYTAHQREAGTTVFNHNFNQLIGDNSKTIGAQNWTGLVNRMVIPSGYKVTLYTGTNQVGEYMSIAGPHDITFLNTTIQTAASMRVEFYTPGPTGVLTDSRTYYPPLSIGNVTCIAYTSTSATIAWQFTDYTTAVLSWGSGSVSVSNSQTQQLVEGLTPSTQYTFTLNAFYPNGVIGATGSVTITTRAALVSQFSASVTTREMTALTVSWSGNHVANVTIVVGGNTITGLTGNSHRVENLNIFTSYTFTVTPYNSDGISGASVVISEFTLKARDSVARLPNTDYPPISNTDVYYNSTAGGVRDFDVLFFPSGAVGRQITLTIPAGVTVTLLNPVGAAVGYTPNSRTGVTWVLPEYVENGSFDYVSGWNTMRLEW